MTSGNEPELANRENSPGLFEWLDMLTRNPDLLADFVEGLGGGPEPLRGSDQ